MKQNIFLHIEQSIYLTDAEQALVNEHLSTIILKKKEHLLEEGNICKDIYFVESGLLRLYCTKENGAEQTTQFGLENRWITDYAAFYKQSATSFSIQALEHSVVNSINRDDYYRLLKDIPILSYYFSFIFQKACASFQTRNKYILTNTGESFYHLFCQELPEFVQRIPQYMLASYLGITPEFLSKIRRKKN